MPQLIEPKQAINTDLAKVWETKEGKGYIRTLAWGDNVEVEDITDEYVQIKSVKFVEQADGSILPQETSGFIKPSKSSRLRPGQVVIPRKDSRVLKVNFVDVQQGDGSVIETPGGKVLLVDGGENQLFARYLAGRFRGTSERQPQDIDCIVVTHGDADHFLGLSEIHESEKNREAKKQLYIRPKRVYHNGLVKRPGKGADEEDIKDIDMLGRTVTREDKILVTELESDLLAVPEEKMNLPFRTWKKALQAYAARGPIEFRRLAQGNDDAFDFIHGGDPRDSKLRVEVLGPVLDKLGDTVGLRFLRAPSKGPRRQQANGKKSGSFSASHTINGHSIILRLTYGDFRFLFSGDLNEEAEKDLLSAHAGKLCAEVFKAPHHGSADFSTEFIKAVSPVISVVSSGDESARKEYIHPRANLIGTLGRYSRVDEPLIFVTEMVAFFNTLGWVEPECHEIVGGTAVIEDGVVKLLGKPAKAFFAFSRTAFGLVKTRTDGKRLLVYTDSGNLQLKEAYAYEMNTANEPTLQEVIQA